ncbi:hypothetical protein JOF29_006331 [Kribbella aluminosa]|uniref:Uncharacterized protein n=1 Tax=Kribbella aluminosa TaxID=416017 RepID=A0ABS4UUA8_9ACTN|nr:hypothetical protein [Kribbella aluminosa]MBP2355221.1 hypothetical protein [Kribbella aluminosa]
MTALLLGVTACGSDGRSSATAAETPAAKHSALTGTADKTAKNTLADLVVLPRGYVADPGSLTGAFTATSYLNTWSADPAVDRALLLNAAFVEGYRATRLSPDKKKRYTVQLFKTGSATKAQALQDGLWKQDTHDHPFALPNALSDANVQYDGAADQSVAVAEASLAIGEIVVEFTVREAAALGTALTPDTGLITTLVKDQRTRLTAPSN